MGMGPRLAAALKHFPNKAGMNNRTDLNRSEVVYKSIIFHMSAS